MSAPDYREEPENVTRSWNPPTTPIQYYLYDDLYSDIFANYKSLTNNTINVFLTHTGGLTTPNPLNCRLRYSATEDHWKLALPNPVKEEDVKGGDYYVYGFIPRDAADGATITPNPTYDEGVVLTINGIKTIGADACAIIGAKEGPNADEDNGLQAGDFKFSLNTMGDPPTNYMYLLFDHLASALSISMKIHSEYYSLRYIKLKELRMQTADETGATKAKMDVTVTLNKNTTGSDPIQSVVYTPVGDEEADGIVFNSEDGIALTDEPTLFLSHFIPHGVKELSLTCVYDVYDKHDKLIRQNAKATNVIVFKKLIDRLDEVKRGYKYVINLTIKPTYLYVLSEPDLDNPTVTLE